MGSRAHHLHRVAVIGAGPRPCTSRLLERVNDVDNRPVRSRNRHEATQSNDEDAPRDHALPLPVSVLSTPVVIQPHATSWLISEAESQESSDQRDEVSKHGDATSNHIGNKGRTTSAAKPSAPVDEGVGSQVLRSSQDTDEEVLSRQLENVSTIQKNSRIHRLHEDKS